MTPVSLMPPVDYCPSCEGRKDEQQAFDIGQARARQDEVQAVAEAGASSAAGATSGVGASIDSLASGTGAETGAQPVGGVVQTLLAPDLAVQASLARPGIDAASDAITNELRLRGAEAYRSA